MDGRWFFSLEKVVPWGRSFAEYIRMFSLTEEDLEKRILGCGDGPASFNAELTKKGGQGRIGRSPLQILGGRNPAAD